MESLLIETPTMAPRAEGAPEDVASLARKVLDVAASVRGVEKTGRNSFHKYDYVTENDLLNAVVPGLEENGVMVFTSTVQQSIIETETKKGDLEFMTVVTTAHTFIDGETGAQMTVYSQGQGSDKGDKGVYKAITGSNKYFLYKSFLKAAGDDPEADSGVDRRAQGRKRKQRRSPQQSRNQRAPQKSKYISAEDRKGLLKRAKSEFGMNVSDVQEVLSGMGIEGSNKIPRAKAGEVWNSIVSAANADE